METPGSVYTSPPRPGYTPGPVWRPMRAILPPAPGGVYAVRLCGQGAHTATEKSHAAGDSMRPGILNTCQASYKLAYANEGGIFF